jgi:multiple sugar transport system substrate-binding protein
MLGGKLLRKFITVGIFMSLIFSLTGALCSNNQAAKKKNITLTVWNLFDNDTVYSDIISNYERENPNVKINYIKKDLNEYELKTSEALAAGNGPDIWMIKSDWMPRHYDKLVAMPNGTLAAKTGKSDIDIYKDTFAPIAANDNIIDNKIYGIPFSIDTMVLYMNKDLFNKKIQELFNSKQSDNAKMLNNSPATWDDVINYEKLLTIKDGDNIKQSGFAIGTAANTDISQDILAMFMLQNHAQMVSADKKTATFNLFTNKSTGEPVYSGTNSLIFYTSFANPSKDNYSWNNSMGNSVQAFMEGRVAMMLNYSYVKQTILQQAPTLNYDVAPLPQIKGTTVPIDYASYWVETVTKNSQNPQEAWNFIKYVATKGNSMYISATKRPSPDSVSKDNVPKSIDIRASSGSDPFQFQKMSATSWYKGKRADKVDTIFKDMIDNVISKGQSAQTSIDAAAAQVTELLKQDTAPSLGVTN